MKLISWNVNGIRAVKQKGFLDFLKKENPDVICLQEIKATQEQADLELKDYFQYWNSAEKKGYSGTAVFSKIRPLSVSYGLGFEEHDKEGRVLTLDFDKFFLVNVYTPNAKRGLLRLDYRQQWDKDFLKFLKDLEKLKPVVFCGDLNVAHKEIDLANPKSNKKNAGFTLEERDGFTNYINAGFVDTFREFNQEPNNYTWWSYMFNARAKNVGWRIDYFCVSKSFLKNVKNSEILADVFGSDHCPIRLTLK